MFADEVEDGFCEVFDHVLGLWLSDATRLIPEVAHALSLPLPLAFHFLLPLRALHLPSWPRGSRIDDEGGGLLLRRAGMW